MEEYEGLTPLEKKWEQEFDACMADYEGDEDPSERLKIINHLIGTLQIYYSQDANLSKEDAFIIGGCLQKIAFIIDGQVELDAMEGVEV